MAKWEKPPDIDFYLESQNILEFLGAGGYLAHMGSARDSQDCPV